MSYSESMSDPDKGAILEDLIGLLKEMTSGWEMQFEKPMGPETLLGADLRLKSLDFVRLAAAIQKRYNQKSIPFQKLFVSDDGRIREDIQLSYLADFLHDYLANP